MGTESEVLKKNKNLSLGATHPTKTFKHNIDIWKMTRGKKDRV
jgi:hypothetical protein